MTLNTAREKIEKENKKLAWGKEIYFDKMQICKRYSSFFLGNGVLQETNDLYLLKKQEQQLYIFESLIKCVLFPTLSLLIWVSTEVHNKS